MTRSKRSKPSCPVLFGTLPPMVPCGFIPMLSLPLHTLTLLCTSGKISRLTIQTFQLPCLNMEMAAVAWLEWIVGDSLILSSKLAPVLLKGYNPHIQIISGPKGSFMSGKKFVSTPVWLIWAYWSITNFSKEIYHAAIIVVYCWGKCHLLCSLYPPNVFLLICSRFCCFVCSRFHRRFCYLHVRFSPNYHFSSLLPLWLSFIRALIYFRWFLHSQNSFHSSSGVAMC